MQNRSKYPLVLSGAAAGCVSGFFGAGGGMILVPLLRATSDMKEEEIFPCSVAVMLPICLSSLSVTYMKVGIDFSDALPYLLGSSIGGLAAGLLGHKIRAIWLHRGLGLLILLGGFRYLCF